MTRQQTLVMWLGLSLVIVRFFTSNQFTLIWSDVVSGPNPGKLLGGPVPYPHQNGSMLAGGNPVTPPAAAGGALGGPIGGRSKI